MSTLSVDTGISVRTPDGVSLATDVVRPSGTGRHPAVVMRTAYDRTTPASKALQVDAMALASEGMAVVLQDVRGRYGSDGDFEPFVNEQQDGLTVIEWAAGQQWCDGRVAMAGISYNAFCQLAPVVLAPDSLAAIVPGLGPADIRTSWLQPGGVDNLGFHLSWLLGPLLSADPRVHDVEHSLEAWDDPLRTATAGLEQPVLGDGPAARWLSEWTGERTPFLDDPRIPEREALTDLSVPALVVGGWFDIFATGSLDLAAWAGSSSCVVVGPWDHSGLPLGRRAGDRDHGRGAERSLAEMQRHWYRLHVFGDGNPPRKAEVFVTGADEWEGFDEWPPASTTASFWLTTDGLGDTQGDGESTVIVDPEDPTPALGGQAYPWEPHLRSGGFDQRGRRSRRDVVSFATPPVQAPRRFVGKASAAVDVDAPPDGLLFLTILDIHPDGSAWNVTEGVAAVAETGPTHIDLGYLGHEFAAGHAIALDVSGACWPRFPLVPGRLTVSLAGSRLTLPEVS